MTRWPSAQWRHRLLAVAVLAMLCAPLPAAAQPSPLSGPIAQLPACAITPGLTLADYLVRCRFAFRSLDADNDGVLTSADRDRLQQRFAAGVRANHVNLIMRADLDGDGVVTRDEAVKYVMSTSLAVAPQGDEAARQRRIDDAVDDFMKADLNHDGVIDAAEMLASAKQPRSAAPAFTNTALEAILARAPDGKVTLAQFDAAAEEVFHGADTDGDGVISPEEFEVSRRRPAPGRPVGPGQAPTTLARPAPPPDPGQVREAACIMPVVPTGAKVIAVSTYRGTGVSTIAIGSQDVTTSVARVTIEDGAEPLYVVLVSAAPVIWQFDGAVARVTRAVLVSNHAAYPKPLRGIAAGVTGLARDAVSFLPRADCIKVFVDQPTIDATLAVGAVRRRTGQEPAAVVAIERAERIWLPSARHETTGEEPSDMKTMRISRSTAQLTVAGMREGLARGFPAGIVRMDAAAVIAGQSTEPYAVLPGSAGLLQLLDEGKLALGHGQEFIVRDKIRWPGGLDSSYHFRIPKGVASPEGNPGQACVIAEDGPPSPRPACN